MITRTIRSHYNGTSRGSPTLLVTVADSTDQLIDDDLTGLTCTVDDAGEGLVDQKRDLVNLRRKKTSNSQLFVSTRETYVVGQLLDIVQQVQDRQD